MEKSEKYLLYKGFMQGEHVWSIVLGELESTLSKANFQTWFGNTGFFKIEDGEMSVAVPNDFVKEWIESKYKSKILDTVRLHAPEIRNILYLVKQIKKEDIPVKDSNVYQKVIQTLPFDQKESGLNPKYTFKNFIIGSFNELSYSAAQAIIKSPGNLYNPFFVYGNTGLGKTHLIQATGNAIQEKHPQKKLLYIPLERFYADFVSAIQQNKQTTFKDKYRKYDVLIMDDIQFISGKEKTQEELFHLFNLLHNEQKQIIFSSDKHPNFIIGLEDRLRTRFSSGMVVDVNNPEFESKIMILKEKTRDYRNFLNDQVLDFIAENVNGSIRELEGILNTVILYCELKKQPLTLNDIKNLIKNHLKETVSTKKPEDIIDTVSKYYNVNPILVSGKTRRQDIINPRQMTIYILREMYNLSYQLIGDKLGGRDHTTIMHSYEKIKNEKEKNPQLTKEIEDIKQILT